MNDRGDFMISRPLLIVALLLVAACENPRRIYLDPQPEAAEVRVDQAEFDAFIATRPTPAEFRARYPEILLIEPGQPATREYRADQSRYFAEFDSSGRIVGGWFS
jgi:hypothetical protein